MCAHVCVGFCGWVGHFFPLLHVIYIYVCVIYVMLYIYVCVCIVMRMIYKLRIFMYVGSISLSCHLPDVFQTCLMNERKAN